MTRLRRLISLALGRSASLSLTALATALAAVSIGTPAVAQAQEADLVVFNPGIDPPQRTGGKLAAQTIDSVKYEQGSRDNLRSTALNPWDIQFVRYGYRGIDEAWQGALHNLQLGNYADAASAFENFISGPLSSVGTRDQRPYVKFATYYYLGRAYLGQAMQFDRAGQRRMSEINDTFPLNLSESVWEDRDRDFDRNEFDDAKEDVRRAINRVLADVGHPGEDNLAGDLLAAVDGASRPSELAAAVREHFRTFYKQFSRPAFEQAIEAFNKPFKDGDYETAKPFWFFEMKLSTARAYLGMGEYGMALSEIDESSPTVNVDGGSAMEVPRRDRTKNPSLMLVAKQLASSNPGYYHFICRAQFLGAEVYETAGDFFNARTRYDDIVRNAPRTEDFARYRNDANLRYGIALSKGRNSSFGLAERHLNKLIEDFIKTNDSGFDQSFLFDPDQASLYAGAYLGLGEIAYVEFQRSRDGSYRQLALENFLRVTAMFSADAEKRAEALHRASKIYREIADEEFANVEVQDWAMERGEWVHAPGSRTKMSRAPRKWQDPETERTVFNPYWYYIDMADKLRTELKDNYGHTKWANAE